MVCERAVGRERLCEGGRVGGRARRRDSVREEVWDGGREGGRYG